MNIRLKFLIGGFICLLLLQLIPYGKNHENPPVKNEPKWDSDSTRNLVKRACFDCHSNETVWPFYSKIAPASWLVYRDVSEARKELNFSELRGGAGDAENPVAIEAMVMKNSMPPLQYRIAHPNARLKPDERKKLIEGIKASLSYK